MRFPHFTVDGTCQTHPLKCSLAFHLLPELSEMTICLQKGTECSKMDVLHLSRDVPCSSLDVCIFAVDAQIFHVHQNRRTLTKLVGRGVADKHFKRSAYVRKPGGSSWQTVEFNQMGNIFLQRCSKPHFLAKVNGSAISPKSNQLFFPVLHLCISASSKVALIAP